MSTTASGTEEPASHAGSAAPALSVQKATLRPGGHTVFESLWVEVPAGGLVAVLGPNGAGKSSLLRMLLGVLALQTGTASIGGRPVRRGLPGVGYVPQQQGFEEGTGLRARDLVALGLDGHRYRPWPARGDRAQVQAALDAVGAADYADRPLERLSGGEQQRVRIAQAVVGRPAVLLCDEPLSSLDLHHQREVLALVDGLRRSTDTAVLMVTHEINPVLPYADRILYLVDGRWALGSPDEVMTSERLSALYGSPVEVLRHRGRVLVIGAGDGVDNEPTLGESPHRHETAQRP